MRFSRRHFLGLTVATPSLILLGCGDDDAAQAPAATSTGTGATASPSGAATSPPGAQASGGGTPTLTPTPACGDEDDPTPAQTEGPYFTPNSPERVSLVESDMAGTRLILQGFVFSSSCQPVGRALVDFWQCDNAGNYDNSGFRLRGHQFTDAAGRYRLETIVPGLYPGRTRHIHVKVQAPNRPVLTTQLYFPNESGNARDGIYNQALVLEDYRDAARGKAGGFNFVLNV